MPGLLVIRKQDDGKYVLGFVFNQYGSSVEGIDKILPILKSLEIINAEYNPQTFVAVLKSNPVAFVPPIPGIKKLQGKFLPHILIPDGTDIQNLIAQLQNKGIVVEMPNTLREALTGSRSGRPDEPPPPPPPRRPDVATSGNGQQMYATNITVVQMNTVWAAYLLTNRDAGIVARHNNDLFAALIDPATEFKGNTLRKLHAAIQLALKNGLITFNKLSEGSAYNIRTNNIGLLSALTNLTNAANLPEPPPRARAAIPPTQTDAQPARLRQPPPPPPPRKSRGLIGRLLSMLRRDSASDARTPSRTAPPRTAPTPPPRGTRASQVRAAAAATKTRAGAAPPTPPPPPPLPPSRPVATGGYYNPIGTDNLCGFACISYAIESLIAANQGQGNQFIRLYNQELGKLKAANPRKAIDEADRARAVKAAYLGLMEGKISSTQRKQDFDSALTDETEFDKLLGEAWTHNQNPRAELAYGVPAAFVQGIIRSQQTSLDGAFGAYITALRAKGKSITSAHGSGFMRYLMLNNRKLYDALWHAYKENMIRDAYPANALDIGAMGSALQSFTNIQINYKVKDSSDHIEERVMNLEGRTHENPLVLKNDVVEGSGQVGHWQVQLPNMRASTTEELNARANARATIEAELSGAPARPVPPAPPPSRPAPSPDSRSAHPSFRRPAAPPPIQGGVALPGMARTTTPTPPTPPPVPKALAAAPSAPPPTTAMTAHMPNIGSTGQPRPLKHGVLPTLFGPGKQGGTPQSGSPSAPPPPSAPNPNARKKPKKRDKP